MADKKTADPVQMWHSFLSDMEKQFNSMSNQAMESAEFSRLMNQMTGASAGAKKAFGDSMAKYLAAMNLPSRSEFTELGERLLTIETRLNEIMSLLRRVHADVLSGDNAPSAARRPPRTKRPPSKSGDAT
jgi:phage tail tape-measure protein